jgi:Gas vesicle synthesis protein GvpO
MPARRTAREERAPDRRRRTEEPEAYEESDAEEYEEEEDGQDGEAYSGDDADEPDGQKARGRRASNRGAKRITAAQAAQAGMRGLVDLIGKQPEGITSVEPSEDDGWLIGVEVIEDQRVPSSADVLAVYEAELDADGDLLSYRRISRYTRGSGDQTGAS